MNSLVSQPLATPAPDRQSQLVLLPMAPSDRPVTLKELFEAEEARILSFAIGLVGRRAVAEELVQETFVRLHQVWNKVENPRAWLYRSLRNLSLNHLRDRKEETELDETDGAGSNDEVLPEEKLGRTEAVGMMRLLMSELDDDDRELIRLKYEEGLKYREISQRTGLAVGTVGYRLHHLLGQLADGMRKAGIEGSRG